MNLDQCPSFKDKESCIDKFFGRKPSGAAKTKIVKEMVNYIIANRNFYLLIAPNNFKYFDPFQFYNNLDYPYNNPNKLYQFQQELANKLAIETFTKAKFEELGVVFYDAVFQIMGEDPLKAFTTTVLKKLSNDYLCFAYKCIKGLIPPTFTKPQKSKACLYIIDFTKIPSHLKDKIEQGQPLSKYDIQTVESTIPHNDYIYKNMGPYLQYMGI